MTPLGMKPSLFSRGEVQFDMILRTEIVKEPQLEGRMVKNHVQMANKTIYFCGCLHFHFHVRHKST